MSKVMYKHGNFDKYDGHMPNKPHWVQDEYYTSSWQESFHMSVAWGYYGRKGGFSFGVQKKMWKASPGGIRVDGHHVGKSDIP